MFRDNGCPLIVWREHIWSNRRLKLSYLAQLNLAVAVKYNVREPFKWEGLLKCIYSMMPLSWAMCLLYRMKTGENMLGGGQDRERDNEREQIKE